MNDFTSMVYYDWIKKMCDIWVQQLHIMLAEIWQKEVIIEVMLADQDNADWCPALPLLFAARWNHYLGFYYQLIQNFFSTFQPFPYNSDTFWVELANTKTTLNGTEIISNLYSLHAGKNQPLQLICHFRGQNVPQLDLKRFFKQNLKASTCIRYGKFGSSVVTVDMTVNNIDDMFNNFKESKLQAYLGDNDSEGNHLGYRFIVENDEKIKQMGVRILGKEMMIERKADKDALLLTLWSQLCNNQNIPLSLHGVMLPDLQLKLHALERYCHPDGFLYFTICSSLSLPLHTKGNKHQMSTFLKYS